MIVEKKADITTTMRENANCLRKNVNADKIKKVVKFVLKICISENLYFRYRSRENATPEKIAVAKMLMTIY
jgi:hypothetical protein